MFSRKTTKIDEIFTFDLTLCTNALSFYATKTVLVNPKLFWCDQIDLDLAIMIWSGPNWDFLPNINHIWTRPSHFGCDHFILVVTKSLWSSPNQFGQTKTILDQPKLFWSHRRTRHKIIFLIVMFKHNFAHDLSSESFPQFWSCDVV